MTLPARTRLRLGLAAAVGLAMAAFCALRMRVTTDITHFLPAGSDHALAQLSRELADSTLTRTLIIGVGGPDVATVHHAAAALASQLEHDPEVAFIQRGPTAELAQSVYGLYASRLPYFVSDHPEDLAKGLTDEALARQARALKRQLSLPLSPLLARLAPADPLQWFPAVLHRFEHAQAGTLEVDGDQLVTPDHQHAILFVGTRHSPFDSKAQGPLLANLQHAFDDVNRTASGVLTLERGGVAPIALDAEARIRGDVQRLSVLSTLGVLLVFLLLFRSVRGVLLAMLPVVAGALTATTLGLILFGKVHAMTLAIGTTLIGVAIDYPILLLTHRMLAPEESAESVVRRVWMGIFIGGLTTASGFAALGWTSFPGVREMAVTSSAGMLAALWVTRYVLPPLLERSPTGASVLRAGAAQGERALAWLEGRPALRLGLLVTLALACLAGLPRLRWLDSLAALNAASPALKEETDRVRARVSRMDDGRFVIATARDEEAALRLDDELATRMGRAQDAGLLEGYVSLHAFLWSADLQQRNRAALAAVPDLGARTLAALGAEGFKPAVFAPFAKTAAALSAPATLPPLRRADLEASPLAALVRPFFVQLEDRVGILTFVRGVKDPAALRAALVDLPGAQLFDQSSFLDETYGRFRVQTLQAIGVGALLIFLVLLVRYRRVGPALSALLPTLLAVTATLGVLGTLGVAANLLHVMSLLIVVSIGVDYGVFLVECSETGRLGPTTMSLAASCATALLSFGVLAFSQTPALRAIGLTTGIGIALSLLFAPLALVLMRARRGTP
jgi:predicted exporter